VGAEARRRRRRMREIIEMGKRKTFLQKAKSSMTMIIIN